MKILTDFAFLHNECTTHTQSTVSTILHLHTNTHHTWTGPLAQLSEPRPSCSFYLAAPYLDHYDHHQGAGAR